MFLWSASLPKRILETIMSVRRSPNKSGNLFLTDWWWWWWCAPLHQPAIYMTCKSIHSSFKQSCLQVRFHAVFQQQKLFQSLLCSTPDVEVMIKRFQMQANSGILTLLYPVVFDGSMRQRIKPGTASGTCMNSVLGPQCLNAQTTPHEDLRFG